MEEFRKELKNLINCGVAFDEAFKIAQERCKGITLPLKDGEYRVKLDDYELREGRHRPFLMLTYIIIEGPEIGRKIYKPIASERMVNLKWTKNKQYESYNFTI